jgi:uncharacterized protein (TIGR04255 family)
MATRRHLQNAPIREALLDIRSSPTVSFDAIASFASSVAEPVEQIADLWQASMELKVGQGATATPSHTAEMVGKRLDFKGRGEVAQLRTSGFTFSKLPPYGTWEGMTQRAFPLWASYSHAAGIERIDQVAVRYINSLQFTLPVTDFESLLLAPPQIPADLPQELAGFMSRVSFKRGEKTATVTQMLEAASADGKEVNFLLDIEVFAPVSLSANDLAALDAAASELRAFKNDVFFGFVTDKAIERYV